VNFPDFTATPRRGGDIRITNILNDLGAGAQEKAAVFTNSIGMKFANVPAGSFHLGEVDDEPYTRANELPRHLTVISTAFYIGIHTVTQAQYSAVMGRNPSHFTAEKGGGPEHPVEMVSWKEAAAFCVALSRRPEERAAGRTYALPSEAQWEYACRAGVPDAYTYGNDLLPRHANFGGGYRADGTPNPPAAGRTTPVGSFPPNNYGLFDVHGNVWEWVADWYDENAYENASLRDPTGPAAGQFRIARGGCWRSLAESCRAAYRNAYPPAHSDPYTGFRVLAIGA
jgi:formylglycine-generating enzyme